MIGNLGINIIFIDNSRIFKPIPVKDFIVKICTNRSHFFSIWFSKHFIVHHIAEWRKFETRHIFHTLLWARSLSTFTKFSETYLLIRTRTCAYQGVRNISISENFTKAWNKWCLSILSSILQHSQVFQIFNSHGIYLFKVINGSTRKKCEICLKLTIKTPEQCELS